MPLGNWPVVAGLSFVPESGLLADWHYKDPPGGLTGTTSYGDEQDKSEILSLRSALGIAGRVTPDLSFGASVGLIYNHNELATPYIFQNLQPGPGGPANSGLDGAKTLLRLQTSGWGWNAQVGFLYRVTPDLEVGASYESPTEIDSTGDATGDPSLQVAAPPGTLAFHYDTKVTNTFPQEVRWGASWKFQPQWRVAGQIDWIDWSDAFHNLPLTFTNGSNAALNGVIGSSFTESIPLDWKNEFVYRVGLEYEPTPNWALRIGYSYGSDPVPASTLTPMEAAIMENTFTTGVGYHWGRYSIDFAYQYDLPATQNIGTSGLLSGEYSNSSITVSSHIFALTAGVKF
jgi:long-chain fatty acid transport protein